MPLKSKGFWAWPVYGCYTVAVMLWFGLFVLLAGLVALTGTLFGLRAKRSPHGWQPWAVALAVVCCISFALFIGIFLWQSKP